MLDRYGRIILMAAVLALMALPARALARDNDHGLFHDDDGLRLGFPGHDQGRHLGWFKHRRHIVCDEDGDDCRPPRRFVPPFGLQPSGFRGFNATPQAGRLAERANLVYALNSARAQYYAALRRGDRRGAKHLLNAVRKLEAQVGALDSRIAPPSAYGPAYYAIPGAVDPGLYPLDPTTRAAAALIPLLQLVRP